ncbi:MULTISPECIES: ribonuclease J [Coprobacillaceae]|uniref:ribonuclease J n=1 Tax=Coprobacillaceae TaxID=2810280 RepID=UPI000E490ADD|nr:MULTISPECIES: ribonuclease J [Coprobacillaceae]RHM63673.1 ribonuclease J [Coprobacillus sp. AF33-1AC]RHS96402.1 ribonuclease J [Erysipelatoclostridium sp. AM42-17]
MKKDVVKILPMGGQAEMGKSMYCIEINEKIFIIDAGHRFPEVDKLGVDIIIPSFDYLKDNKDKIVAVIITHGHDDVMMALPYLLEEINVPIYAPNLTADLIEQMIHRYQKKTRSKTKYQLNRVKRNDSIEIAGVPVEFFPVTHSIPGSVGVALWTNRGYIVYGGEFIIDFGAPEGFGCDIQKMMEIGKKGVLALLCESSYAKNDGYTSPKHKLTSQIEQDFEDSEGRIIISSYAQNIFRSKEIVELAKKYNRRIVFYGRDKYDSTNSIVRIGQQLKKAVISIPKKLIAFSTDIAKEELNDRLVILLSGSPRRIYHDICDIIDGGDEYLKLKDTDTFVVASPVLPGTEKIANKAINELYKTDSKIHVLKNKELYSMHASQEDIKVIIQIFKPKYFIPIKGEYQHFIACGDIARGMNIKDDHIIIIDNGERISFKGGKLEDYRDTFEIEDVMIDGIGVGDVGAKVIDDRIQLSNDGVVIIGVTIDSKTKKIIANTDVQTRGFVYLKDSENIIKGIIDIAETCIKDLEKNPELEVVEVRQTIKEKTNKFITKETGKKPVILPIVIEV